MTTTDADLIRQAWKRAPRWDWRDGPLYVPVPPEPSVRLLDYIPDRNVHPVIFTSETDGMEMTITGNLRDATVKVASMLRVAPGVWINIVDTTTEGQQ